MVSVIIPNFNRVSYLEACLNSLLAQSYVQWEALVVDDGSTDGSKNLVESLAQQDSRVHWLERSTAKKGSAICRNIGIQEAQKKYVIFLDSDDLLAPHCLAQRIQIMKSKPKLDFAVFKMQFFNETPGDDQRLWNLDTGEHVLDRFFYLDAVWQTTGPIWKKSSLKKIGGFDPNLQCWQDIDIHLKALLANLNFKLFFDLPVDCYYRKNSENSISQQNTNSLQKLNSKAHLCSGLVTRLGKNSTQANPMILNILISATNGMQFKFFGKFLLNFHQKLSLQEKISVIQISVIRLIRLDKISILQSYRLNLIKNLSKTSTIGAFKA